MNPSAVILITVIAGLAFVEWSLRSRISALDESISTELTNQLKTIEREIQQLATNVSAVRKFLMPPENRFED